MLGNAVRQRAIARRVHAIEAGADHGDGGTGAAQCPFVGGAVDAQRQPRDHAQAGAGQGRGKRLGVEPALHTGIAAADHGDQRTRQQLDAAGDIQQQRRIGDLGQRRRVQRIVEGNQVMAGLVQPGQGRRDQAR